MRARQPLMKLLYGMALCMALASFGAAQTSAPTDANGWEKQGTDALLAGKYAEAIPPLQKALDSGFTPQIGKYDLACAYARIGDKTKALTSSKPSLPVRDCQARSRTIPTSPA